MPKFKKNSNSMAVGSQNESFQKRAPGAGDIHHIQPSPPTNNTHNTQNLYYSKKEPEFKPMSRQRP
jgi:hypothetical protein